MTGSLRSPARIGPAAAGLALAFACAAPGLDRPPPAHAPPRAPEAPATPPGFVRGIVLEEDGRPIAAADVLLLDEGLADSRTDVHPRFRAWRAAARDPGSAELRTRSDEGGRFAFPAVPPGRYVVAASAGDRPPIAERVVLAAGTAREVEITLSPACALEGVARGESGSAFGGAVVEAVLPDGSVRSTATGPDGHFRLEGLPPTPIPGVTRLAAGGAVATSWRRACTAGPAELELPDPVGAGAARIHGIVRRAAAPVARAELHRIAPAGILATTDSTGRFSFAVPEGAKIQLEARLGAARSEAVEARPGAPLALELRAPGEIEIHVSDVHGDPLSGAAVVHGTDDRNDLWVREPSGQVTSGPDGFARLRDVPPGPRAVVVTRDGMRPEQLQLHVRPGAGSRARVRLEPAHDLVVRVIRAGEPVVEGPFVYRHPLGDGARVPERASVGGDERRPGPDGVVRFRDLPAGRYEVYARNSDGSTARAEARVPGPIVQLELPGSPVPPSYLAGRVLLPGGAPARGAGVIASCLEAGSGVRETGARTGASGRFRFPVPDACASYLVRAEEDLPFRRSRRSAVEARPGDQELVLRLREAAVRSPGESRRIEGVVIDEDRQPVPDLVVVLRGADGGSHVRTGQDGTFRFEEAPSGALQLDALGVPEGLSLRLPPEATRVRLRVPRRRDDLAPVVRAQLVRPDGAPVTLVSVDVSSPRGGARKLPPRFLPDGRLELPAPAMAELELHAAGLLAVTLRLPDRTAVFDAGVVRFEPEARLSGVVVRADGTPVAGAIVELEQDGKTLRTGPTNGAGWFLGPPMRPGKAIVVARHRVEGRTKTAELDLAAGEAETRLVLDKTQE